MKQLFVQFCFSSISVVRTALPEMNDNVWKTFRRLGELLRQEQERLRAMKMEGHAVYLQYVQQGRDAKISKQVRSNKNSTQQLCRILVCWCLMGHLTQIRYVLSIE